uniref:hypothetical protein n=1 Tax=Staphylococcus aureus TaxID=1280 RepID=UPI00301E25BC
LGRTQARIEHELPLCAAERVGIVFGTSHWTRSGVRNPYFDARMSASARLLRLGRSEDNITIACGVGGALAPPLSAPPAGRGVAPVGGVGPNALRAVGPHAPAGH